MRRLLPIVSAAAILAAPSAGAQVPARPPAAPLPPFHTPPAHEHTLPNGLHVVVVEDHSVPIVAVRAVFGVDESFDPPGKEGLFQVTQGALREGTTAHSPEQLATMSAQLGTSVAPTSFTTTPTDFSRALALMGEMLSAPSFPQAAIDRRKAAVAATQRNISVAPAVPARNLFNALARGRDDPYVRGFYANGAAAEAITRDDVIGFYRTYFGPRTTTIVVAGDVTEAKAVAAVTKEVGGWTKPASLPAPAVVPRPAPAPTTIYLLNVPRAQQAYLDVGGAAPTRGDPDEFAVETMGTVVANRVLQTLREKKSFIYSGNVAIVWRPVPFRSDLFGSTSVQPAKADSALLEWIAVLRGLRGAVGVTSAELDAARRARVGPLFTRIDGPDALASRIVEAVNNRVPLDYLARYAAGMNAVTAADVDAASKKYIDVDHLVIVVTGDRAVLEPALRAANIAPIVIVDANGKPLASTP